MKIELNSAGIRELLKSPEIQAVLNETASRVQSRAGENYGTFPVQMPGRSIVRVSAINKDGMIDNSDNNTLLKALHGG